MTHPPAGPPTPSSPPIENADRLAVALSYAWGQAGAPTVVARGRGALAERIVRTASESGVPVRHDPGLAQALGKVEVGLPIPPEAFLAVAEILGFLYRLDGTLKQRPAAGTATGAGAGR